MLVAGWQLSLCHRLLNYVRLQYHRIGMGDGCWRGSANASLFAIPMNVFNIELFALSCFLVFSVLFSAFRMLCACLFCFDARIEFALPELTHTLTPRNLICFTFIYFNKYAKICYFNVLIRFSVSAVSVPGPVSFSFARIIRCISYLYDAYVRCNHFRVAFLSFIRGSLLPFDDGFSRSLISLEFPFSSLDELIFRVCRTVDICSLAHSFVHSSSFEIATCTSKGYFPVAKGVG